MSLLNKWVLIFVQKGCENVEPRILSSSSWITEENINYSLNVMRFNILWNQGYTGEGMVVGVVDSGIDYNHPMFGNRIIEGYNFSNDGNPADDIFDYNYHGTAVTSLISGKYMDYRRYGVAPDSKIIVAKSMNASGKGSLTAIANGINYCVEKNVDVINCSVGSADNATVLENAVRNAVAKGIPVVVASGNDGHNDTNGSIREISYPASYDDAICVGAMDKEFNITGFSNSNEFVDFVAPGKQILTAYPSNKYALCEGTSFACPLVSGILLLLKQKFIDDFRRLPNEAELYGMLMRYTRELQGVSRYMQGHGYIDCSINRKRRNK